MKRLKTYAPVGAVVALLIAFLAAIVPAPAFASDTYGVKLVNAGIGAAVNGSGLNADVEWASTAPYTRVFLWPDNTSLSQQFDLLDSGNGYFRIRARHSGQCLMLDWRSGYYNGTAIIQYPYCDAGYAPSEWTTRWMQTPPSGIWAGTWFEILINRQTGQCLDADAPNGVPVQQAQLQVWTCISSGADWNVRNQMWTFDTVQSPPR
jgi:hypothetical protein